jgi:hypothetical protein
VEALGNPTGFALSPEQAHDLKGADALLPDLAADALIADTAYDADERVLKLLEKAGKPAVSRPRAIVRASPLRQGPPQGAPWRPCLLFVCIYAARASASTQIGIAPMK